VVSAGAPKAASCVALIACLAALVTGCGGSARTASQSASGSAQPELGCKKPGIRYASTNAKGAQVCFTLSPSGKTWLEIGYLFIRGKGCPAAPAAVYFPDPIDESEAARLVFDDFTARIHGTRAAGIIKDSNFCRGKRFEWSARATQPLPAQARTRLGPFAGNACKRPGIHYAGQSANDGVEVCFTLSSDRSHLVESGWSFERASGCEDQGAVETTYPSDVGTDGYFEDSEGLTGTIRGAKASGELSDYEHCRTLKWTARRKS